MGRELYQIWRRTACATPGRTAVHEADGRRVSFASLQREVENHLRDIRELRNCRDRILAIQFENSSQWLSAFLAGQASGAIVLPFDPDIPPDGLRAILETVHPAALWTKAGFRPCGGSSRRRSACLVKLTSGSTGLPKALVFEDAQMIADGNQVCSTMGIRPEDINLALVPFGHSYGLGNLVMPLIQYGNPVAACSDPFPHAIASRIQESGASVVPAVPAILSGLARAGLDPGLLSGVRLWISAGSPLHPAEAQQFLAATGSRIHNFYGSSETGGIAFDRTGDETLEGRSAGLPLSGVEAAITVSGRLRIRSRAVFRRGNTRVRDSLGEHVMADLAEILEDGSIRLHGRRTRMVKITGKRLNLAEVEGHLRAFGGVEHAYVRDYRDANGRTRLAAVICPEVPIDEVRENLRRLLPPWKIPQKWLSRDRFPLTARGKVNTRLLDRIISEAVGLREK